MDFGFLGIISIFITSIVLIEEGPDNEGRSVAAEAGEEAGSLKVAPRCSEPIRGQYPGQLITLDQSEARINQTESPAHSTLPPPCTNQLDSRLT